MSQEESNKTSVPMDGTATEPVNVAATGTAIEQAMDEAMRVLPIQPMAEQAVSPRQELYDMVDQAVESRRFCVAVFRLVPDANPSAPARIYLNLRTNDFPEGDYAEILRMLKAQFSENVKKSHTTRPLVK